jgi:hypothetical protein
VEARDGSYVKARALLDNASSASFISERLAQHLQLPRSTQNVHIYGIAGSSPRPPIQSIVNLHIKSLYGNSDMEIDLTAIVLPKITCDLPVSPVPYDTSWSHISDLPLADPAFGLFGRIDLLLGVDIFISILLQGRRSGPAGAPVATETVFGWVLSGNIETSDIGENVNLHVALFHSLASTNDDVLRMFWEIEESPSLKPSLSIEENSVVKHFNNSHHCTDNGIFVIPLPKKPNCQELEESRSLAVRRFLSLERSLCLKGKFGEFEDVIQEYFNLGHAEPVPIEDIY